MIQVKINKKIFYNLIFYDKILFIYRKVENYLFILNFKYFSYLIENIKEICHIIINIKTNYS